MPSNPPSAPDPYRHPTQYADYERAHGRQSPAVSDESTSRLRAENEALRAKCEALEQLLMAAGAELAQVNNKATVREVAEELRVLAKERVGLAYLAALAGRLDPPPVVEK